ncbi:MULTISPECIES: hypothetical protein [unclassified Methylobacterium]|uniref:hypothetical protein n=1 Tax=unclassified Methylobacterium TaxID=2615210 RepID=UPI00068AE25C|nr:MULTISPECIES: hypothetical protein [unclassified Methylobacterium]MDE4909603.1 hypothetical protein [Methylobacterium sp. 092160098-2]SFV11161.1 hypothetical protein SAMN02799643_05437 [Methylobacterium sp. UNCCL125]
MKRILTENRGTIDQIKRAITGGGARTRIIETPSPEVTRAYGTRRSAAEKSVTPYIRLSPNGRVVVADFESGRQLHHVGDLRGPRQALRFVLATKENGYFAPLDAAVAERLAALDGTVVTDANTEDGLKREIAARLGIEE